jgi:hypothetical protein
VHLTASAIFIHYLLHQGKLPGMLMQQLKSAIREGF